MPVTADDLFRKAQELGASDVHMVEGSPVQYRIDGTLQPVTKAPLTESQVDDLVQQVLGGEPYERLQKEREIDVSYAVSDELRLRVNCHFERGNPSLVARIIPQNIPTIEEAELTKVAKEIKSLQEGLILFTGPTGAGKSTSMAALLEMIRKERNVHIITLEDPIEFVFPRNEQGLVRQRQFGQDFLSFGEGLKRVLRQDPDVIMVGEMRDQETVAAALTLAETGHLVFGTLHTPNTTQAVDRIVDVFPSHQQAQIRSQLSLSLRLIIAQRLLPKEGGGRVAMREVLVNTSAVAHIIRESRLQELPTVLQTGTKDGMQTFQRHAEELFKDGQISQETYDQTLGLIGQEDGQEE